jgi:signal transduction histidine kinase
LNEAMHELRRPLQVLSLSMPADRRDGEAVRSSLELTAAALERLDREINGEAVLAPVAPVELRPLLEAALARWQGRACLLKRSLRVRFGEGEGFVTADRFELSQALDNLINNALEHGTGLVTVEMQVEGRFASIAVRDAGRAGEPESVGLRARLGGRRRHGHGLRLVRRVAQTHGGSFDFRSDHRGSAAVLRLPLHRTGSER